MCLVQQVGELAGQLRDSGARMLVTVAPLLARAGEAAQTAGVDAALRAAGCAEGDTLRIGKAEFTYAEDAPE